MLRIVLLAAITLCSVTACSSYDEWLAKIKLKQLTDETCDSAKISVKVNSESNIQSLISKGCKDAKIFDLQCSNFTQFPPNYQEEKIDVEYKIKSCAKGFPEVQNAENNVRFILNNKTNKWEVAQ